MHPISRDDKGRFSRFDRVVVSLAGTRGRPPQFNNQVSELLMPVNLCTYSKLKGILILILLGSQSLLALPRGEMSTETRRVLSKMDEATRGLSDLTSDVKMTKVTVVVDDTALETGRLFYQRGKKESRTRIEYQSPETKTLVIDKGKAQLYEPGINRLTEFSLGKNRAEGEFLSIGFGPSNQLTRTYDVGLVKEEVLKGQKTSVLELKPKSTTAMFKGIQLWIDESRWIPVQMRLTETSGDYLTIEFENIQINTNLTDKTFRLNVPSNVQKIKPANGR
jgi:outer membrane lipoprotein-sorting protein